jgi:hypothetical protein
MWRLGEVRRGCTQKVEAWSGKKRLHPECVGLERYKEAAPRMWRLGEVRRGCTQKVEAWRGKKRLQTGGGSLET